MVVDLFLCLPCISGVILSKRKMSKRWGGGQKKYLKEGYGKIGKLVLFKPAHWGSICLDVCLVLKHVIKLAVTIALYSHIIKYKPLQSPVKHLKDGACFANVFNGQKVLTIIFG